MPEGVIFGGWSYVTAAYVITAVGLVGYLLSLRRRKNRLDNEE